MNIHPSSTNLARWVGLEPTGTATQAGSGFGNSESLAGPLTRDSRPSASEVEVKFRARSFRRQQLIAQEKARLHTDRLTDADMDRIATWLWGWQSC